jgi:hypothetical protein
MFRASLRPSSREKNCLSLPMVFCLGCSCCGSGESGSRQHPLHSAHISLPDSPEPQQLQPGQKAIGSDTQFCSPDDGRKDARNTLRNNRVPINHYLMHLVGLAFICLYKMHGHSNIKKCSYSVKICGLTCDSCMKTHSETPYCSMDLHICPFTDILLLSSKSTWLYSLQPRRYQ